MKPAAELLKFFSYLAGKKSEVEDLEVKDVLLAKAVLDIHRKKSRKETVCVPLFQLHQVHRLDRPNALATTRSRIEALRQHRQDLVEHKTLTCDVLARVLPSVSWIKVVQEAGDSFLAFEGNGRIAAMQAVFGPQDGILVEVERYTFRNPGKILRRLNRVRRLNGLQNSQS
jgi:hypothetical protein